MFGHLVCFLIIFVMVLILQHGVPDTIDMHLQAYRNGAFTEKYWELEESEND